VSLVISHRFTPVATHLHNQFCGCHAPASPLAAYDNRLATNSPYIIKISVGSLVTKIQAMKIIFIQTFVICDFVENMHVEYFSYSFGLVDSTDGEFGLLCSTDRLTKEVSHRRSSRCFLRRHTHKAVGRDA
jgi:hypothetical protein